MRLGPGILILATLWLSACGGVGGAKKAEPYRPAPVAPGDDAPRSKYGNPESYEVFGKTYYVLATAKGYRERGLASWYGEDFHGKRTSSGEPYNMHAMTAAHKTLPLPSYVRVTNLRNQREVLVRVNDRGPFHADRVIDLSFAAATELGIVRHGTADVEVVAVDPVLAAADAAPPGGVSVAPGPLAVAPAPAPRITDTAYEDADTVLAPDEIPVVLRRDTAPGDISPIIEELPPSSPAPAQAVSQATPPAAIVPAPLRGHYLQAGAFSEPKNADALVARLRQAGFDSVSVYPTQGILKVRLGPYSSLVTLQPDRTRLISMGIRPYLVEE